MKKTTVTFNRLSVFSTKEYSCFVQEFSSGVNLISGRNTSGKSTLISSLLYTFGINDVKSGLHEILQYNPIFRVDFTVVNKDGDSENYVIVRNIGNIYIKKNNGGVSYFLGIDADQSKEHIKFKEFINHLFGFSLTLERQGNFKPAPIECMFLPYYVSQSVGWVYVRESFSNLHYFKNFKDDFLDYYLGVTNEFDKEKFSKLSTEKEKLKIEIRHLNKHKTKPEYVLSSLLDEHFGSKAQDYISEYGVIINELHSARTKHVNHCNELSLLKNHKRVLSRTKSNIKKQTFNSVDRCPACTQILQYSLEGLYSHYQKLNDTISLESHLDKKMKSVQTNINSDEAKIFRLQEIINEKYDFLSTTEFNGFTFEQWIENKTTIKLLQRIDGDISNLSNQISDIEYQLSNLQSDDNLQATRSVKEKAFKKLFIDFLEQLHLKIVNENRYLNLYSINSFPYQGVELHKTVMAYHFALNKLISTTEGIHRLPFLLDGIMKEDIDGKNIELIFNFVAQNLPSDTQSFITIAEHSNFINMIDRAIAPVTAINVHDVNDFYFKAKANVIYIGDGVKERAFFSQPLDENSPIFNETINIINN